MFLYGWTADKHVFWIAPIIGTGFGNYYQLPKWLTIMLICTSWVWSACYLCECSPTLHNIPLDKLTGIQMPIQTYLVDAFTIYAASAIAASTVLRSLVGAVLPLAGQQMYDTLGLGWGNSLLAFIATVMCPIPVILYKYGERIRKNPRFQVEL